MAKRKRSHASPSPVCSSLRNRLISRRSFLETGAFVLAAAARGGAQDVASASRPRYQLIPMPGSEAELRKQFTAPQLSLLEKLNRRDVEHLLRAEPRIPGLVVPEVWADDELACSPMPATCDWAAPHAKAIVVHQPVQAFGAYENGQLVRWGPVSTGRKETPTPAGEYNLTWRSRKRRSTDNDAWVLEWYFNFINERGVSFHHFDLPGYPASHACVRLRQRDAVWLYGWGEQWTLDPEDKRKIATPGSAVWIAGECDYKVPGVWTDPERAAHVIELTAADR